MKSWTLGELKAELSRYERELTDAGLAEKTIFTYTERAERFLRWLEGSYVPGR